MLSRAEGEASENGATQEAFDEAIAGEDMK